MYTKTTLKNGLTLLISEQHTLPLVTIKVLIRAGALVDPPGKAGLANLVARIITQGTSGRTALQIAEEIEFVGGYLAGQGEHDYALLGLIALKKDLELGMEILAECLLRPTFPREEIRRLVKESRALLQKDEEDPGEVAIKAFLERLLGDHPYGKPEEGTPDSLSRIRRADILELHQRYYTPNNVLMAMVGDLSAEEAQELCQRYLGGWEERSIPVAILPDLPPLEETEVIAIDRPFTQANIVLGHLGIRRGDPDYYAVSLMNYILGGGGFASRLLDRLRDDQGLVYDIGSHYDAKRHPGAFAIDMATQNGSAGRAILATLEEMNRLCQEGVSEEELADTKAFLVGSFPLVMDTNEKIASLMLSLELYELGPDYPSRYAQIIQDITPEDVMRVAEHYLHPERYLLVVVAQLAEASLPFQPSNRVKA